MAYPLLTVTLTLALLVCASVREAGSASRPPAEVLAAARRAGVMRSLAAIAWGAVMVPLLVLSSIMLATTAAVASLGEVR